MVTLTPLNKKIFVLFGHKLSILPQISWIFVNDLNGNIENRSPLFTSLNREMFVLSGHKLSIYLFVPIDRTIFEQIADFMANLIKNRR